MPIVHIGGGQYFNSETNELVNQQGQGNAIGGGQTSNQQTEALGGQMNQALGITPGQSPFLNSTWSAPGVDQTGIQNFGPSNQYANEDSAKKLAEMMSQQLGVPLNVVNTTAQGGPVQNSQPQFNIQLPGGGMINAGLALQMLQNNPNALSGILNEARNEGSQTYQPGSFNQNPGPVAGTFGLPAGQPFPTRPQQFSANPPPLFGGGGQQGGGAGNPMGNNPFGGSGNQGGPGNFFPGTPFNSPPTAQRGPGLNFGQGSSAVNGLNPGGGMQFGGFPGQGGPLAGLGGLPGVNPFRGFGQGSSGFSAFPGGFGGQGGSGGGLGSSQPSSVPNLSMIVNLLNQLSQMRGGMGGGVGNSGNMAQGQPARLPQLPRGNSNSNYFSPFQ